MCVCVFFITSLLRILIGVYSVQSTGRVGGLIKEFVEKDGQICTF